MEKQLTLNYDAGLADLYSSCRECIQSRIYQVGRPQKAIAADMDYSPSTLSRKLTQSPHDSQKFTLDDFELYMSVTKDIQGIFYLVDKYICKDQDEYIRRLEEELARAKQKNSIKAA